MIEIRNCEEPLRSHCKYSLGMQDDSVFADFDLNDEGCLLLVRISFDGYGCCNPDTKISFSKKHTRRLIKAIDENTFNQRDVQGIVRNFFIDNSDHLWVDALKRHHLI